ncbi:MAG: hypothetical protein H6Q00_2216, partial [Holophagaceae bacterium]|nr:hypothetical protein [Holophagaceae bacterium]
LTIFDFSGSMARLMYHPLYPNTDVLDNADYAYMSFNLMTSTYTVKAKSTKNSNNYITLTITVGGGCTSVTSTGGTQYLSAVTVNSSTFTAGSSVTFTATVSSGSVTWTASGGSPTSSNNSTTFTWTVPSNASIPYVTASLSGNSVGPLTSSILVKPDGTQVTYDDAEKSKNTSSGFYGASVGALDVRNWVRAASHVRFAYTSGSTTRTVDVPIPWKVMCSSSTSNPLSSYTVLDQEVVTKNGTSTTYGTGNYIEMDTVYSASSGSNVLSGSSSTATSTSLRRVGYNVNYVDWLFTGKYSVGSYAGSYIVFDAVTLGLAGGQNTLAQGRGFGADAANYTIKVPDYNLNGTYAGTESTKTSSINLVPALTRSQAVKRAAITTWINHQADVLWAFRFLDTSNSMENGTPSSTKNIDNSSSNYAYSSSYGCDSAWQLFNGSSASSMALLAGKLENNGTPLTYATARSLAQFTDPSSVFNTVEKGTDAPSQCMNHFLILFTDGLDNNNTGTTNVNMSTPYISGSAFSAKTGNTYILANKTSINQTGSYWNLFTFAGIAAHMSDSSLGTAGTNYLPSSAASYASSSGTTTATPAAFLPYAIASRGTGTSKVTFSKDHKITTMAVGVSLGGQYTDSASPKRNLFYAAVVGDPTLTTCADISTLIPFKWDSANEKRVSNSIYFFDGNTPDTLSSGLGYAIQSAIAASNINTTSNPNLPYVGASLGGQIYVGKFRPPTNGGSIWGGDLLMFNTILSNNNLKFLDTSGAVTTTLDTTTAQWSARDSLYSNRLWSARKLYSRIPRTDASTAEDSLKVGFSDTGAAYATLKNYVAQGTNKSTYVAGGTAQLQVIRTVMGGDYSDTEKIDSSGVPTTNRSNIMGDIINSSPAAIEFKFSDVAANLTGALAAVGGDRFRLILVGTNQGWIHAFGEVTKATTLTLTDGTTRTIRTGAVDELWSFMPTDFLSNLDQVTVSTNAHRFMVDGTPLIYHLDLPPTGGGAADGVVEISSSPGPERCLAIFGLGKGGRSYYAINLADPFTPVLQWSLRPDESTYLTTDRILTRSGSPDLATVKSVVANMGFSTCTPAAGRVQVTATPGDTSTSVVRDVLFLGGGHSVPEVEANFTDSSSNPILLGRSVLALDVYTGKIIAAVDMSSLAGATDTSGRVTMGPVSKGVVPFEFVLNSGMAQRAYFMDFWGGLWSWGRQMTDADSSSSTYQYRMDSSDMSTWTSDGVATSSAGIRLVAKDRSGNAVSLASGAKTTLHYSEALYSTLPAPFRVSSFPGKATLTSSPVPAAVGIALESGDRNNPLDYYYTSTTLPSNHRLSVIFDRQDSLRWGFTSSNPIVVSDTTSHLLDAYPSFSSYAYGDAVISQGNSSYYLAPSTSSATRFGYYRKFPTRDTTTKLVPKGINSPMVVSGSLYYSYFTPTEADVCTGGSGYTYSNLICDVMNPVVVDARTTVSCQSGSKYTWIGVASDYTALGNRGVIQTGTVSSTSTSDTSTTALAATTLTGKASAQYPKPRVWRTVH